jgi:hypothetical protein
MRHALPGNQPTISALHFSHTLQFLFIRMSKADIVIAGLNVCVAERSATIVGRASGDDVIVSSSVFSPSMAATLRVANIGRSYF